MFTALNFPVIIDGLFASFIWRLTNGSDGKEMRGWDKGTKSAEEETGRERKKESVAAQFYLAFKTSFLYKCNMWSEKIWPKLMRMNLKTKVPFTF
jgi:hypothetical protein